MDPIRLLFSGDFAPLLPIDRINNDHFVGLLDDFANTDLHVTNLECPLTFSQNKIGKTGPSLKAEPGAITLLKQAKVNIACLANNHIFDYGEQGIEETIKTCEVNNIDTLGIVSRKDHGSQWLVKNVKDKKIGFLNYCEHEFSVRGKDLMGANGYDPMDVYYDINQLKPTVDFLILIYHGGNEYYPLPRPNLKKDFHFMADLGADVVIGHHTHVFSGYEIYKNKPLIYSLGNFFFPSEGEPESWHYGLLCILSLDCDIGLEFKGVLQCKDGFAVDPLTTIEENRIKIQLEKFSDIIKNSYELEILWNDFVLEHGSWLKKLFLYPTKMDKLLKRFGFTSNSAKRTKSIFNIIRCSSLNNLLLDSLKIIKK